MSTTLVFNGNARVFPTDFIGADGVGYAGIWEAFWADLGADLRFVQGPGAVSLSSVAIGTGAKSLTLAAAANLKAGLWRIQSAAGLALNTDFMIATLAADLVAGTALDVTSQIVAGSGTKSDWIIMPVWGTTRRVIEARAGNTIITAADDKKLLVTTGTWTQTFDPAASLGKGFSVGIRCASGAVTLDPDGAETVDGAAALTLRAGQAIEIACDAVALVSTARNSPLDLADIEAIALSFN